MQNHENFILLGANTIIIILVLIMLFRMQDNKIKAYLKKSEKKLDYFIKNQQNMAQNHKLMNINPNLNPIPISMSLPQQPLLNNNENIEINNKMTNDDNNHENDNNIDNDNDIDIDSYIDPLNE